MRKYPIERWLFGVCADGYHPGCRGSYFTINRQGESIVGACSCDCHVPAATAGSDDRGER